MPKLKLSPDVAALNPGIGEVSAPSKYMNQPTEADGIRFDSKAEVERYAELKMLQFVGQIHGLRPAPGIPRERFQIGAGRHYTPDFTYSDKDGQRIAEDVKGKTARITEASSLRMALFRERYPHIELLIERR